MNNKISNYAELRQKINDLQSDKSKQEERIRQSGKEMLDSMNPINIIKKYFNEVAHDSEVRQNILSAALNIGSRFVIEKLFKNNKNKKNVF